MAGFTLSDDPARFDLARAHGLYRRFGFTGLTGAENWMEIRDPDVYRR